MDEGRCCVCPFWFIFVHVCRLVNRYAFYYRGAKEGSSSAAPADWRWVFVSQCRRGGPGESVGWGGGSGAPPDIRKIPG